ncbi:MAG TPA: cyanophycin synthetase [Pyrinomonadaceae bacterium]|nr:cyanophycin synthetase [Pyrinomonadaceae bacterium]
MHNHSIRTLAGPNVYSHRPVLLMRLDLEELDGKETREFKGFNDRLLACLPGLNEHQCSLGRPGGFVQRLEEGTYFGHVVEHVAIELAALANVGANHGKTRHSGEPRVYNVAIEYKAEQASRYLLAVAVRLVTAVLNSEAFPVGKEIWEAKQIAVQTELGPSTRAIVEAAERRNIPWRREGEESLVQLGYGKHRHYIQAAMTDRTSATAVELVQDKDYTKALLSRAGIPVPEGRVVRSATEAIAAMHELGAPVVVKPLTGRQGNGVSIGLETADEMQQAYQDASLFSPTVLVEKLLTGRNYRLLVVDYKLVAASERTPCTVVGDGKHTIKELIDAENRNPLRGEGHEKPLTQIRVDHSVFQHLKRVGLTPKSIPHNKEEVTLSERVNLSAGATARDVTDEVHPSIKSMCERAARLVGLDVCGVDLITENISEPVKHGGILELNAGPGLRMHCFPSEGQPRDVGGAIVEMIYPKGDNGRIPIISVTGTNGKTTVTRMISHVLESLGQTVGMTTTDGIYIGGERIVEGDTTGPGSAQAVLSDPSVDVAVLETARGGIVRRGLGYDWSNVGVITNIGEDHLGQDGIKTIEDVVYIKSLVAERVCEGGTLVLNADNEQVVGIGRQRSVTKRKKRIFYFSLNSDNPVVREHLDQGGTAFLLRDGWLWETTKSENYRIIDVASVPATMNGSAEFQVANLLAAIAACRAHNVPRYAISKSLKKFTSYTNNPGRVNLYKLNGGHVMVDYGHNPNAFEAICRMASKWENRRVTGVIGVPGDRDDSLIVHAGRIAARGFHRLIIREDHDLRGRKAGVVAQLLCDAALDEAPETDCKVMLDEHEALHHAVKTMQHGEVVVVFYEKLEPLRQVLEKYAAQPVQSLNALNEENRPRRVNRLARTAGQRPLLQLAQARRSSSSPQL